VTGSIAAGSFVLMAMALLVSPMPLWAAAACVVAWASASAVLGWWLHRWPEIEHRHASYRVDEQGIEIRHGVVWRRVINVPRSRVQHTDVSQGPVERGYGLGTLSVFTAGTEHARVGLSGLDHATALAIRDHLLPRGGADAV
jgi:membrane protein YdbS with pleckstrin-like domain